MAQQIQESDSATPDKQALISVLKYLKKQNLKETEEALKKELGIAGLNVVSGLPMALKRGETEPAKYEECYESQDPSSSTCTTTGLQSASVKTEATSSTPSKSPRNLKEEKRSLSWPGCLPHWQQRFPTSSSLFTAYKPAFVATPDSMKTKAQDEAHIKAKDNNKTLLGASSPQFVHPTTLTLQNISQQLSQIPAGTQFVCQVAPTAGFSVRQPILTPVLTVLPTGMANPSVSTASIPMIFSSTNSLSLPLLTPPTITQKVEESKPPSIVQKWSPPEPTTGQQVLSPVSEAIRTMGHVSPPRTLASIPYSEMTPAFSDLKTFAEEFKTKRIRLGYTQGAVGQSLADKGYSNFAQSTISRFEQMQLSPTNAAAIKQVLEKWLQEAESPTSAHSSSSGGPIVTGRKRKKRAVFTPQTRSTLEEFFRQSPRPNRQQIEAIAYQLDLLPEEVRVWFCNKRQKQKQHQNFCSPYEKEVTFSATPSGASSPSSPYEQRRNTPSPKTSFTIEELSKSSANSSTSSSPVRLISPFTMMSPPESAKTTTAQIFPMMLAPSSTTAGRFVPSSVVTQTKA